MKSKPGELLKTYIWYPFIDTLFPPVCWLCDQRLDPERHVVCVKCFSELERFKSVTVEFDGPEFVFNHVFIMYEFNDHLRNMVHMIKYQNCPYLAVYFAQAAYQVLLTQNPITYDRIIPVPLHPKRLRERGYNQSAEIVRHLSTLASISDQNPLQRIIHTPTQTKLSKQQRIQNISGVFSCSYNVSHEKILLVDDVITTGSTVNECARILINAGAASIDVLALANPRLGD